MNLKVKQRASKKALKLQSSFLTRTKKTRHSPQIKRFLPYSLVKSFWYSFPWWLRRQRICLRCKRPGLDPSVGKISWRREWQPPPEFLSGKFHGQRSLVCQSPQSCKELDTTEQLTLAIVNKQYHKVKLIIRE